MQSGKSRFDLGRLLATPGALRALEEAGQTPLEFISRHASGDWGELCDADKKLNDEAVVDGSRILSSFRLNTGQKLWVISEAANEQGRRACSTILRPEEY